MTAAKLFDQRVPGGLKRWLCVSTFGGNTHVVEAATKGEARAALKAITGVRPRDRLPPDWVITLERVDDGSGE